MGSSSTSEDPSDYTPSACVSEAGTSPSSSSPSLPLQTSTDVDLSEVEMMKERFAKLLLGEDMSGGGKGVCTALAVSNAITNLSASVFGQLWRLEPLKVQKKEFWKREMEWLLSICDSIVELVPSLQEFPLPGGGGSGGGGKFEVMVPRLRSDLRVNLPALRKLDAMLVTLLDGFHDTEFWYVDRGVLFGEEGNRGGDGYPPAKPPVRQEDKWWLPCPRVPPNGLSEEARRRLEQCRDYANQILKAALVINSEVLADMAVPQVYYETLPQSGKSCLGDFIYQYITTDRFSSEFLLDCLDLSSEHQTLEIVNCVEAACQVWRKKAGRDRSTYKKVKKPSWSGKVKDLITDDSHKSQFLAQRAELLLQSLKLRYPGLPQTVLDMNKIQFNKDVGQSILESYSRVIESLAFNIIARVDDLIYVDDATKKCAASDASALFNPGGVGSLPIIKRISPCPSSNQSTPFSSPFATPRLCFSNSLCSAQSSLSKRSSGGQNLEDSVEKAISADVEAVNLETGNLILAKDSVATLE